MWLGETLRKAEKSRTRTYGPPSACVPANRGGRNPRTCEKMGANKEKQESLKTTLTQLSNRLKPVYKMLKKGDDDTFVLLEKKSIKNQNGKGR